MKYEPDLSAVPTTVEDLHRWVSGELQKLYYALQILETTSLKLEVLYAEPTKYYDGLLVIADGTSWNPGGGRGLYEYVSGTGWVQK